MEEHRSIAHHVWWVIEEHKSITHHAWWVMEEHKSITYHVWWVMVKGKGNYSPVGSLLKLIAMSNFEFGAVKNQMTVHRPMPSSSARIPMSICASQCLFSHSFITYEWLNRDCDVQIYIALELRADELGIRPSFSTSYTCSMLQHWCCIRVHKYNINVATFGQIGPVWHVEKHGLSRWWHFTIGDF
jgi:hypothetical protein